MLFCRVGRSLAVWMFDGRPKAVGSTVLSAVRSCTYGATFCAATEPRMSVWRWNRMFVPNLKLCAPFSQLRLLTNCQRVDVRSVSDLEGSGSR